MHRESAERKSNTIKSQDADTLKINKPVFAPLLRLAKPIMAATFASALALSAASGNATASEMHTKTHSVGRARQDPIPRHSERQLPVYFTQNWSGFIVKVDFRNPKPMITSITGSWKVPNIWRGCAVTDPQNAAPPIEYSSVQWEGIGGDNADSTLIQMGVDEDYLNDGTTRIYGQYELLPSTAVQIPASKFNPRPGDLISSRIELVDKKNNIWKMEIIDNNTNQRFAIRVKYKSLELSGEWIEENPEIIMRGADGKEHDWSTTLGGFSEADFVYSGPTTGNYVTINGRNYGISELEYEPLNMNLLSYPGVYPSAPIDLSVPVNVNVSRLKGTNGESFSTYYEDCRSNNTDESR